MHPRDIALNYIKFWFWIDLAATVPIDRLHQLALLANGQDILSGVGGASSGDVGLEIGRINRLFRALKVFKIMRLMKMGSAIESIIKFNPSVLRLSKFLSFMVMSWHWFGCIWWLISDFQANEVLQKCYASATKLMSKAECFAASEEDVRAMSWGPEASICYLRLAWVPSTSVRSGGRCRRRRVSTSPRRTTRFRWSSRSQWPSSVCRCSPSSSATHRRSCTTSTPPTQRRQKLETIEQYMKYRRVPKGLSTRIVQVTGRPPLPPMPPPPPPPHDLHLSTRIVQYYQYLWTRMQSLDDKALLGELPYSLQLQLALVLNRTLFTRVPIFKQMETTCIVSLSEDVRNSGAILRNSAQLS